MISLPSFLIIPFSSCVFSYNLLRLDHIDTDGVPVYSATTALNATTWVPSKSYGNCWYMQIGIKYLFN